MKGRTGIIRPVYHVEPDPEAAAEIRAVLLAAGVDGAVVDHGLTGRDFDARGGRGHYGWADPDQCIRALVEAGLGSERIAAGMGLLLRVVSARREKLRIGVRPRHSGDALKGEEWRPVPGYRNEVSNLGRVRGPYGLMHVATKGGRRARVPLTPDEGGRKRMALVASLVFGVFHDRPINTLVCPRNGDRHDCRLVNLEEGRPAPTGKKADKPWISAQDRALRSSKSWEEAARRTGHTIPYVKKRMAELGLALAAGYVPRPGKVKPLAYRDLAELDRAVVALQAVGLSERTLNLGLRVTTSGEGRCAEVAAEAEACAVGLSGLGWSDQEAGTAMGVSASAVATYLKRAGMREWRLEGCSTKAGPVDFREDEEWRPVPGLPYRVSSQGRVANQRDDLISQFDGAGRPKVGLMGPKGGRRIYLVTRLVLAAFKPDLSTREVGYLDGDPSNAALSNLVPKSLIRQASAATPSFEAIRSEARALCPPGLEDQARQDVIAEAALLFLEGRASSVKQAVKAALRSFYQTFGHGRETSLDAMIGDNLSLGDLLNAEGEIESTGHRKRRGT